MNAVEFLPAGAGFPPTADRSLQSFSEGRSFQQHREHDTERRAKEQHGAKIIRRLPERLSAHFLLVEFGFDLQQCGHSAVVRT